MVAQPPFSMSERRSQDEETLLNATSFAAASVCCWNLSTQIGASAAMTAVSARWVAIFSAVLPSVHPSCENPTTASAIAPATAPHTAGFTPGWIFIFVTVPWESHLALGRRELLRFLHQPVTLGGGEPAGQHRKLLRRCPPRPIVCYPRRCLLV